MKRFLIKIIFFSFPIFGLIFLWLLTYGFPPPKFSNSLSLDGKIEYIKETHLQKKVKILALGSSMSLNNLDTKVINQNLSYDYLNISSWGQNMEENYYLFKIFENYFKPKILIISSNIQDFNNFSKNVNYSLIVEYLFSNKNISILKNHNLKSFLKNSRLYENYKNDRNNYISLDYDIGGGVKLGGKKFNINKKRWEGISFKDIKIDTLQYNFLDSISNYCKSKGIKLYFIQSPYRVGYFSNLNKTSLRILNTHKHKIDSILKANDNLFIDTQNENWNDSLFVDYSHLNKNGAKKYTELFIQEIKKH